MSKNVNKMIKQAQRMQSQLMKAQEELHNQQIEGSAGGGMVRVTINGANDLVSIKLAPEVVDPKDIEMLEDLIIAAFKNGQEKLKDLSNSTFGSITGGLKLPGLE